MSVRVVLNQAEIERVFHSPAGPVFRYVHDVTEEVRNAIVRRAPRDTGQLAASMEAIVSASGNTITGWIGSRLDYASHVARGTGIYGPTGRRIVPVHAKALRFKAGRGTGPGKRGGKGTSPEKRGPWVFAASVKGSPPNHFMIDGLEDVLPGRVRRLPLY